MRDAIGAAFRRFHHAPWVIAAIVLAAGVGNWALLPAAKDAPAAGLGDGPPGA